MPVIRPDHGRQRLLYRVIPHGLALVAGLMLLGSFGFGITAHAGMALGLPLAWLALLTVAEPRLWRDLRFVLPVAGRLPARRIAWVACLGLAACWWLAGWPVGPVLVAGGIVLLGRMFRRFAHAGLVADREVKPEGLRLGLLLGTAFFLILPYATTRLVGAGDAEHYARQMADVITQLRAGEFPVYVGQSLTAFEGAVHPLRTSPGMPYLGGLLDALTGFTLTAVAVQNLLIVLALLAAVTGAYAALTRVAPHRRWECVWLALLYGSSPGILALVYAGDMYASWLALPWLPWLFLGWILAWREPARSTGPALQAVALALIWLVHAPIALWCSLLTLLVEVARWLVTGCRRQTLWIQAGAALLCLLLCHYVMVSVITLEVPANPYLGFDLAQGAVFNSIRDSWTGLLRTVSPGGANLAHDLQLSPGLLVLAVLGVLTLRRTRGPGIALATTALVLLILLVPWTGVTDRFWSAMPVFLMTVTEKWPVQRFYPLLSALLPFLGALALTHPRLSEPRWRRVLLFVLALSVGWSSWEARKFVAHGRAVTHSQRVTDNFLRPENNTLSRYSYEMWGHLPATFSYGYMDPDMQNRLIDPLTNAVLLSNLGRLVAATDTGRQHRFVPDATGGHYEPTLILAPGTSAFVSPDFQGRKPEGTLLVEGRNLARNYPLPQSGGTSAFGPDPGQARGFTLHNESAAPEEISLRFLTRNATSALLGPLTVLPFDPGTLPFRLRSLIPYELDAITPAGGWMETPKIMIPGYQASVDGHPAEIARSPGGQLMVRLPAGQTRVRIEYHAPLPLAVAFWCNAAAFAALGTVLLTSLVGWRRLFGRNQPPCLDRLLPRLGYVGAALGVCAAVGAGLTLAGVSLTPRTPPTSGHYRFQVLFPVGKHEIYETLFSWRDAPGATTSIVAFYESDRFVRIGCRKNGVLKVLTGALPASYFVPHEVEVIIGPLLSDSPRPPDSGMTDEAWPQRRQSIRVLFNGHEVWTTDCAHQSGTTYTFAIGREILPDQNGPSQFRGQIIGQPRL